MVSMDWPATFLLVSAPVLGALLLGFKLGIARRAAASPRLPPGYLDRLSSEHQALFQAAVFHLIRKRYECSVPAAERILDDYNEWEVTAIRTPLDFTAERDLALHHSVIVELDRWAARAGLVVPARTEIGTDSARRAPPPN